jgi:anti-sigma28 factor (negative regulator of flagellin synthesis)
MVITCVSRVDSYLCTHLSKLRAAAARFTTPREDHEEGRVARDQQQSRADRDPTGSRERRVDILRDLIADRGYDVPAEDVAASIIRDAIVIASPTPRH